MFLSSVFATMAAWRKLRIRFAGLLVRRWLLYPLCLMTLPVPVTLNRLAAPLCVFIFGISSSNNKIPAEKQANLTCS